MNKPYLSQAPTTGDSLSRLLPERIAFLYLDLEERASIEDQLAPFELGLVVLEAGKAAKSFSALCLPEESRDGDKQSDRTDQARPINEVFRHVRHLIGAAPLLHIQAGDQIRALLQPDQANRSFEILDAREILLWLDPCRDSYCLNDLERAHGITGDDSESAASKATALCEVLKRTLHHAASRWTLDKAHRMRKLVGRRSDPWGPVFSGLIDEIKARVKRGDSAGRGAPPKPSLRPTLSGEAKWVGTVDSVATQVFGPEGVCLEQGLKLRPSQLEMAQATERAFDQGSKLAVEAPTGTGKSLAYLVPAMAARRRGGGRVLVATATKNLQHQLFDKDSPQVHKILGGNGTTSILMGRDNYFCRTSCNKATTAALKGDEHDRKAVAYLFACALTSKLGIVEDIAADARGRFERLDAWLPRMISDRKDCKGEACPLRNLSPFMRSRDAADKAQIVITNHDLALLYPLDRPEHLVIDEAHELEESATRALTRHAAKETFANALSGPGAARVLKAISALEKVLEKMCAGASQDILKTMGASHRAACEAFTLLDDQIQVVSKTLAKENPEDLLLREHIYEKEMQRALQAASLLAKNCTALAERAVALERAAPHGVPDSLLRAVVGGLISLELDGQILNEVAGPMVLGKLQILQVSRDRKTKELAWVWNLVPVDVQQALARLYRDYNGVVLTSATLFTDNACQDGVLPRIGWRHLDESAKTQLCLKPTFSENNVRTVLLTGIHSGKPMTCTAAEELAHCALEISRLRDGGILALFAATARVRAFGRMAKQHAPPGIRVAVQGDASRQRLTKLMRQGDIDLLVGTKSFYNGIDIPGENLSVVILDKVPFLFPSHLVKARTARVEQNGGNGFRDYILPLALIALRQGIGRLQRSESDTGVIILVADGWLDKPYSKDVERILPGTIVRISGRSSLLDAMNINQPSAA